MAKMLLRTSVALATTCFAALHIAAIHRSNSKCKRNASLLNGKPMSLIVGLCGDVHLSVLPVGVRLVKHCAFPSHLHNCVCCVRAADRFFALANRDHLTNFSSIASKYMVGDHPILREQHQAFRTSAQPATRALSLENSRRNYRCSSYMYSFVRHGRQCTFVLYR